MAVAHLANNALQIAHSAGITASRRRSGAFRMPMGEHLSMDLSKINFAWESRRKAPFVSVRGTSVAHGSTAYFNPDGEQGDVFAYEWRRDKWCALPQCPQTSFGLAMVHDLPTAVGGRYSHHYSNETPLEGSSTILSLKENEWVQLLPSMPTARVWPTVVVVKEKYLVVAGGRTRLGGIALATVEVLDLDTHEWHAASSLPEPLSNASVAVSEGNLWLLGGLDERGLPIPSVYTCSVELLLKSCHQSKRGKGVWQRVSDLPALCSTVATLYGKIVAVGGIPVDGSSLDPTAVVYIYDAQHNVWPILGYLTTARHSCLVANTEGGIVAVGGILSSALKLDSVEFGSVQPADTTYVAASPQCAAPPVMIAEESIAITDGEKPQDVVLASGLRLHIPEGALSPNTSECTLTVRSFLPENGGPFLFPPNTEPVSAVYEITTPSQMTKAVSLKVEHCLEPTELASAQFTLAESPSNSPYKFASATVKHAIYDTHGEIAICQSSLLAIIGPRGCAIRYCAQLYHQRESLTTHFIHFVLVLNLQTTVQAVAQQYSSKGNTRKSLTLPEVTLSKEADKITLSIPKEGITVKQGWRITPAQYPCAISRDVASYFKPIEEMPSCQIQVKWEGQQSKSLPPFQCPIKLIGTENPEAFLLHFTDKGVLAPHLDVSPMRAQISIQTDEPSGVEIVAKECFTVQHQHKQTLGSISKYGVALHIPKGALQPGATMQVKACLVGKSQPFIFPDDSELVSAVYHITASDKPSKEISLEMEHCATIETEPELSHLCFVTANSSTGPPYHFKYIDQGSKFRSTIGQIKVPHFSWLGIVWKKFSSSLQRVFSTTSYHALLYCENVEMTMKYLHFVVVKDLQVCIEAVEQHFSNIPNARKMVDMAVTLKGESNSVQLDVDEQGTVTNEGWSLTPAVYPLKIKKKLADYFTPGKGVPKCVLAAKYEQEIERIPALSYRLHLIGAEDPTSFQILLPTSRSFSVTSRTYSTSSLALPLLSSPLSPNIEHIQSAAEQLEIDVAQWEDNDLVSAAKRIASHMIHIAKFSWGEGHSYDEIIDRARLIVEESNCLTSVASMTAIACTDREMSQEVKIQTQRISNIAKQLQVVADVKAYQLKQVYNGHASHTVAEILGTLADNANNLKTAISKVLYACESATIRVRDKDARLRWKRRVPRKSERPSLQELQCLYTNEMRVEVVREVAAWWDSQLAPSLGFEPNVIEIVRRDASSSVENACQRIFQRWLRGEGRQPANWHTLIESLDDANFVTLAKDLQKTLQD